MFSKNKDNASSKAEKPVKRLKKKLLRHLKKQNNLRKVKVLR